MKKDSLIKLGILTVLLNILAMILSVFIPMLSFNILMVTLLAAGLWIFWQSPFKEAGYSYQYDLSTASILVLMFFLYGAWVILSPILSQQEIEDGPCSINTIEKKCYTFTATNCKTVWTHYENECQDEIRKTVYEKTPSALVGPITKRCIYQRLDKAFQSTRRTSDAPICQEHFQKLDNQLQ